MKQYYFSNGQEPSGPFTLDELSKHSFTPDSLIWHEGMTEWLPANEIPEVRSLITVVPPPIRRSVPANMLPPQATPTPVSKAKPIHMASPATSGASVLKSRRKYYLLAGVGILLAIGVMLSGALGAFSQSDSSYVAGSTESAITVPVETPAMPSSSAMDGINAGLAQAQAAEQVQKQVAIEQAQKRDWNREHFLEFFNVFVNPNYSVGTFGGISGGSLTVQNNSGYRLEKVTVDVRFYKPNGELINIKSVQVGSMAAHEEQQVAFPASNRGVRADCHLMYLQVPGLEYEYSWVQVQQAEIEHDERAEAANTPAF